MSNPEPYVAALDVGTTSVRCQILNRHTEVVGSSSCEIKLLYPKPGYYEIDPNDLYEMVVKVIRNAIKDAKLIAQNIKCLGISTQRSTFTTWRADTGEPLHNFITWKDIRARKLCKRINTSALFQTFRSLAYSIYIFSWSERFLTGSRLKIAPNHVTGRLLWVLENLPDVKVELEKNNLRFGTVDTWLLYKFSGRKLFLTDISNASATGFFDTFVRDWGFWAKYFLRIPVTILPKVVENDYDFGSTEKTIFGAEIPIKCVMADQSSSMLASCCFHEDDIKVTLGTGAFMNVNTANKIHTSVTGMYPLIAWKLGDEVVHIGEVSCNDCGSLIQWLLNIGFIDSPEETYNIALSIPDSDGVYFVPAFSGLGPPINDIKAGSGFIGVKPTTAKSHLVRAVLESMVYRVALAFTTLKNDRDRPYDHIIVDGGVSNNDFICQLLADITNLTIKRLSNCEMSVLGVGFLAGLKSGVWKSKEDLADFRNIDKQFKPAKSKEQRQKVISEFNLWLRAIDRFKSWYQTEH